MQVKKQKLEPDMEQQTGSKLGKEYIKAIYCHPVYLTYMQSTSCEMLGWMKHKLESRLPGERLLCPWDFPGNNTGMDCHFLLHGIFLTQRLNLSLLHWQLDSLPLSQQGNPIVNNAARNISVHISFLISVFVFF